MVKVNRVKADSSFSYSFRRRMFGDRCKLLLKRRRNRFRGRKWSLFISERGAREADGI